MATTTINPTVPEAQAPVASTEVGNLNLVREKQTMKGFTRIARKADGSYVIDKKTKQPVRQYVAKSSEKSWAKLLAAGWEPFNENAFFRYTLKTELGFQDLVVPEQRVRIQQSGVNYMQSTKSNALAIEVKEGTGVWKMAADGSWTETVPAEPANNNTEFDMRELINQPPQKKKLSDFDRMLRFIKGLGLSDEKFNEMVALAQAQKNSQAETDEAEEEDEEEVDEEAEGEETEPEAPQAV